MLSPRKNWPPSLGRILHKEGSGVRGLTRPVISDPQCLPVHTTKSSHNTGAEGRGHGLTGEVDGPTASLDTSSGRSSGKLRLSDSSVCDGNIEQV